MNNFTIGRVVVNGDGNIRILVGNDQIKLDDVLIYQKQLSDGDYVYGKLITVARTFKDNSYIQSSFMVLGSCEIEFSSIGG